MKDYIVVTCLYVDDMLIISITINGISKTKSYLSSNFKMKDLGEVDTILRIKVKRTNDQISLSQSHYIEKILTKFQHLHIKESNVPFEPSVHLKKNSGRVVSQLEYASYIGCLMYATHCTRPDIAFAVSKLSQYTSNPSLEHWRAVSKVLRYLKRTSALNLTYTSYPRCRIP
ncbi:retrovirus-related pol polyprotein from transposon TNT 1-94 [Tanacetum coccineum]